MKFWNRNKKDLDQHESGSQKYLRVFYKSGLYECHLHPHRKEKMLAVEKADFLSSFDSIEKEEEYEHLWDSRKKPYVKMVEIPIFSNEAQGELFSLSEEAREKLGVQPEVLEVKPGDKIFLAVELTRDHWNNVRYRPFAAYQSLNLSTMFKGAQLGLQIIEHKVSSADDALNKLWHEDAARKEEAEKKLQEDKEKRIDKEVSRLSVEAKHLLLKNKMGPP